MKIVLAGVAILLAASVVGVGVEVGGRGEDENELMERIAIKLERTKRVAPETTAVVSDFIHRYNCEQLSCGAVLEKRNHAARIHLQKAVFLSTQIEGL